MQNNIDDIVRRVGNVYLNALTIVLNKPSVTTIKIEMDEDAYSNHIRPRLERALDIAYWTPRPKTGGVYTSYLTSINSSLDVVKARLRELESITTVKEVVSLVIDHRSIKLLENAIMKRFISLGWQCSRRYGNVVCRSYKPLGSKCLFTFYRAIEFRVTHIGTVLLVVRPHLHVVGPSLRDLIKRFGEQVLQKITNRECVALHKNEGKHRKAMILNVRKVDVDKYVAKVIFYNGVEEEVDIEDVRLAGNVLFYKKLITELFTEQDYKQLEKMQRSYAFSLGPKESSFKLAETFKDELLNIISSSGVFPFKLGDVEVNIKLELYRVTESNEVWSHISSEEKIWE